jgi:ABC-2 type transport system permease protein
MNPTVAALRAGVQRGRIEFRQSLTAGEIIGFLWPSIVAVVVLFFLSDRPVPGTDFALGTQAIPGLVGVNVVLTGMLGLSLALITDREDGTLLRAKAIPNGMLGYLTGKVVAQTVMTGAVLLVVLVPAIFLFDGLWPAGPSAWLTLLWVLVLGLAGTLPLGAVIGAMSKSVQGASLATFLVMGLVAISGVFYPITALPQWLQWVGQAFPIYWLGLGMRSALLPDAMAAVEIGASWRPFATAAALAAWAALAYAAAPPVLRRLARRP